MTRAALVIDAYRRETGLLLVAIEQDCRDRWAQGFQQMLVLGVGGHDEQAIDAPAHRANGTGRLVRVAVHVAEQQLQPVGVSHPVDATD